MLLSSKAIAVRLVALQIVGNGPLGGRHARDAGLTRGAVHITGRDVPAPNAAAVGEQLVRFLECGDDVVHLGEGEAQGEARGQ